MREVIGYKINNGDIFDGTLEQFVNCFFSNNDEYTVREWCKREGFDLEVLYSDG